MSDSIPGVVVDTSMSPNARLKPVSLTAVELTDSVWSLRLRVNRDVTLPAQHCYLEEAGRLENFCRAAGALDVPFQGIQF
jgi:hypothetical protein